MFSSPTLLLTLISAITGAGGEAQTGDGCSFSGVIITS